ncbi:DUF4190 domain-containing protein [Subtercola boreus]|uniref:DUF4190 domain-containing protein n=1 Tax=Subtercola boreus TaxID=120213 RepID=A0A3E0W6J4_9MICO|nr:DUF4190 domain-containing protein [Subtercola boreus]RFA18045.1 hypothetical protein B7R24_15440 [Subtercola boreus]RFA18427.1 hypothetical protein B7R23_15475 [Subtercola boreus]RFA24956.1 hypothetical protein B7R25_15470 [Subtercola boreus]
MSGTPYAGANPVKLNTLAIVAIIGGFVFPLAGIICGVISLRQIKETGERGHGLALGGIIVGIAVIIIGLLVGIISAVAGAAMGAGY